MCPKKSDNFVHIFIIDKNVVLSILNRVYILSKKCFFLGVFYVII